MWNLLLRSSSWTAVETVKNFELWWCVGGSRLPHGEADNQTVQQRGKNRQQWSDHRPPTEMCLPWELPRYSCREDHTRSRPQPADINSWYRGLGNWQHEVHGTILLVFINLSEVCLTVYGISFIATSSICTLDLWFACNMWRYINRMDGCMDGWMDGWIDGLMDWWIDGLIESFIHFIYFWLIHLTDSFTD